MSTKQPVQVYTEEGTSFPAHAERVDGRGIIPPDPDDATLEELTHLCDCEAAERNNPRVHRILAGLLREKLGRTQATAVMREIARHGGLDSHRIACRYRLLRGVE